MNKILTFDNGKPVGTQGIFRDITERKRAEETLKESEERYKTLFESAAEGILITDIETRKFKYANPAICTMLGYSHEELIKMGVDDIHPKIALEHILADFTAQARGEKIFSSATPCLKKDGTLIYADIKAARAIINGKAYNIGFFSDVTGRRRAQQAQERLNQQLQARVHELEALSYGIAHDLRSPMLSVEGLNRLLQGDIRNHKMERVEEDVRLIDSGVRKMHHFLNRTLEYSRAGHLLKRTNNVPFGNIVKEAVAEFAEPIRSIGATVSIAETFPKVYVDRMRIRQVLTNLLQNSIKYRDKERPLKIDVGYRLSKVESIFFIRDNGIGIDESETEKVFDLFYRGTTDSEGSGAGLAIVKRIIEAHGGKIWVEIQRRKGTTICFTLSQQSGTNKENKNGED